MNIFNNVVQWLNKITCRPHLVDSQVARVVKNPPANAGDRRDVGSIPWSGRFPGEGNGYPLQYSCLENSRERSLVGYSP